MNDVAYLTSPITGESYYYKDVVAALQKHSPDGKFNLTFASSEAKKFADKIVNQHPIDAHLEACYVPERGDVIEWLPYGRLQVSLSYESAVVMLRRLCESNDDMFWLLAGDILSLLELDN